MAALRDTREPYLHMSANHALAFEHDAPALRLRGDRDGHLLRATTRVTACT